MITDEQYTQVKTFLLSKKLPLDILIEVNDHFVSQIIDLQNTKNLSFEEAFAETQQIWEPELHPTWDGSLDLEDKSKLLRDINKSNFWYLIKKGLKYSSIVIALLFTTSFFCDFFLFKYIFIGVFGIILFFPIYTYFKNYKEFRLFEKNRKYILVSVQQYTVLTLSGAYFYFKFFIEGFSIAKIFQDLPINYNIDSLLIGFLFPYFILTVSFVSIFAQKIYLQKIKKVEIFFDF